MQFKQVASHVNLMPARYLGGNLSHFKNATLAARKKFFPDTSYIRMPFDFPPVHSTFNIFVMLIEAVYNENETVACNRKKLDNLSKMNQVKFSVIRPWPSLWT